MENQTEGKPAQANSANQAVEVSAGPNNEQAGDQNVPSAEPTQNQPPQNQNRPKKSNSILIIVIVAIVALLVLAAVGYFGWKYVKSYISKKTATTTTNTGQTTGPTTVATPAPAPTPSDSAATTKTTTTSPKGGEMPINGYVIPESNTRIIAQSEITSLTPWQLKVARNEIYARHGRSFVHKDLECYFTTQNWYKIDPNYSESSLSYTENKDVATILNYEQQIGSSYFQTDSGC